MKRSIKVLFGLIVLFGLPAAQASAGGAKGKEAKFADGVVYHDRNGNQRRDSGERGIRNVRVSNGRDVVETDWNGQYRLPVDEDTILFVIKPKGWRTPIDEYQLPRFYYIHKPKGSPRLKYPGVAPTGPLPESINFPLYPQKEPKKFRMILLGDTQVTNQREIDYLAHDIVEELLGVDAAFGLTLGDNANNDLSVFDSLARTLALTGIPWRYTLGNHDMNYDALTDELSDEAHERFFGPSYYSFDYGSVHFIVLNDVEWLGPSKKGGRNYRGGLGEAQLEFVQNDLARVPENRLVVLTMHIPLMQVRDREALYRLIEDRPYTLSLSAHYHTQRNEFFTAEDGWNGAEPHHHLINVTACGSWWSGAPDELGLPHATMADGAPNGYSILTFDGHAYSIEFKAARRPADYQMNIFAPEVVKAAQTDATEIFVNVFAGSERSRVEMRLGNQGTWIPLEKVMAKDPFFVALKEMEERDTPPAGSKLPRPRDCWHLWRGTLPQRLAPGAHLIHVRTSDLFGHTYRAHRVIRIVE